MITSSSEIASTPSRVAVAGVLRRWVALGVYGPGDRLPTERELAEMLGVGRATVREAIRLLADEGLFATSRGRSGGTVVLDDSGRSSRGIATASLQQDVCDNFDFRLGIEPMAARLAAERAGRTERQRICALSCGDATSYRMFRTLDSRFHLAVVNAADNRLLLAAVEQSRLRADETLNGRAILPPRGPTGRRRCAAFRAEP
jgi:DNA-binding FadR family transcriptional regulator